MFTPTSLAERLRQWFISAAALTTSSSSQMQAYGPILLLLACGPTGPSCGPEFRPWWPSRWHTFYFLPVFCFHFCFIYFVLFLLTTKNLFILFYFVSNYLFIFTL